MALPYLRMLIPPGYAYSMLQGQPHGEHLRPFTTVAIVYLLLYGFLCAYYELGIYHTLQLRGRIRHIKLYLPPSICIKLSRLWMEAFR